ncbi:hypothetical protein GW17_00003161 [Ensete ventricosum]|nr:hypothetical protein GW17_00003161 [Ensete ventricosum]
MKKGSEGLISLGRSLRSGVSRAVFSEELKATEKKIFDPQDAFLLRMNRLFVASCILSMAVDPLFFYLPVIDQDSNCVGIDRKLAATATTLRTLIDAFYLIRMALQFRTAYIAPSSRVFGRGELVIDPTQIAIRYLRRYFIIDFLAVLPLPQVSFSEHTPLYLPSVADDTAGGDESEAAGLRAVDAPPPAAAGSPGARPPVRPVQVAGDAGGGRGKLGADPPQGPQARHQAPPLSGIGQKGTYVRTFVSSHSALVLRVKRWCLLWVGHRRQVPLFANMDERLLDAICERLKPSLYTENTYIVREGDPVDEMLFIIRGRLESITTDGGRSGFFNRSILKEGDFCGEELLTWALDPKSGANLPSSTRTVKALTEVEAFALFADELKFVASQFRRLHSRQVQHTFRFYSQQWRTWAACFIQAAWRRYSKRKAAELRRREEMADLDDNAGWSSSLGATIYASRFAANALRGVHRQRSKSVRELVALQKPPEPDFAVDDG